MLAAALLSAGSADGNVRRMKVLRRVLVAVGLAAIVAAVLRLRGSGGQPPKSGGWRELSGPELR